MKHKKIKEKLTERKFSIRAYCNLDAMIKLQKFEKKLIGTPYYMGISYFWNYEYRHYMRQQSSRVWVQVHDELLRRGLDVSGVSDEHEEIIKRITKLK